MTRNAQKPQPYLLVVDDDADGRESLGWLLELHGFVVRLASSAAEAFEAVASRTDLIILDVMLPDLNGLEVCRRLRAAPATAAIPILMLSGHAIAPADQVRALDGGADGYLTKPANPDVLVAHIKSLLRIRRVEAARSRLAAIVESSQEAIVGSDWDGIVTDWNPAAERLLGWPAAEAVGRPVAALIPPDRAAEWPEVLRRVRAGEWVEPAETVRVRGDGSRVDVLVGYSPIRDDTATPVGIAASIRDVTVQRRVTAELRIRDRAMQAVSQGILITDPNQPDNPIIYANPAFERMTGYAPDEVLGRNCRFLQGKNTDPQAVATLRRAVRTETPCRVELLNYRKDKSTFWNDLAIAPVRDGGDRVAHFIGVQTDVSERRQLEEQYRHVQKMEAVGRLAGGVAHDFNNLLTVINGCSELLAESEGLDDFSRALIAEILAAGERSAALTRQLLVFSRQQVVSPQVLDVNALVASTANMLRRLIGEDVQLVTAAAPALWKTRADPGQIEQVLMNLCVNARDAMPGGGKLTIETQNVTLDEAYARAHPDARPGPHVLLAVSDTGVGIPPDLRDRIFEPFFTTKEAGKGTGLGLATAYGIVKQAGGHVGVYSEVGVGTTFKVYLPRHEAPPEGADPLAHKVTAPRGTETIFLVEDEAGVRSLSRLVLTGYGYTVHTAANPAEAMKLAEGHRGPLDLLITDVVMPGGGGRAVAEFFQRKWPGLPVLFVSGYTDDAVVRHGILYESVNFLQKPFTPTALAVKVRDVLDARPDTDT